MTTPRAPELIVLSCLVLRTPCAGRTLPAVARCPPPTASWKWSSFLTNGISKTWQPFVLCPGDPASRTQSGNKTQHIEPVRLRNSTPCVSRRHIPISQNRPAHKKHRGTHTTHHAHPVRVPQSRVGAAYGLRPYLPQHLCSYSRGTRPRLHHATPLCFG